MRDGYFGAREAFFILLLGVIAVVLAWVGTLVFRETVEVIGSMVNMLGFGVWLMFQGS